MLYLEYLVSCIFCSFHKTRSAGSRMSGLDCDAMSTPGNGDDPVSSPITLESMTTAPCAATTDDTSTNTRSLFDGDDEDEAAGGSTTHGARTSTRKRHAW